MEPNFTSAPSQTADIDQIPAPIQTALPHRREIFRTGNCFDDILLVDFNPFEFDISNFPPSTAGVAVDLVSSGSEEPNGGASMPVPAEPVAELGRSLTVESNYLDRNRMAGGGQQTVERRHQNRNSVGGSSTVPFNGEVPSLVKRAMPPEKLAEIAKVDPKRAKRIVANRLSAAKSKERKMRYATELEKRVITLRDRANDLSARASVAESGNQGLVAYNTERKVYIEGMKQEAEARTAYSDALKQEVELLRNETKEMAAIIGYPSLDNGMQYSQFATQLASDQLQNPPSLLLAPQQPQLYMPPPPPPPPPPPCQSFNGYYYDPQQPQLYMPPPPPSQSFINGYYYDPNFSNFNQTN